MQQFVGLLFCLFWWQAVAGWAQGPQPVSLAELAIYGGADRDQVLVAGAKKEGKLVWYTAMAGGSYKELARSLRPNTGSRLRPTEAPAKTSSLRFWRSRKRKNS